MGQEAGIVPVGWVERPLLAIDSSTAQAGLALFDGSRVAELSWAAGRSQTTTLLAEIHHLLTLNGVTADDLAAVAVATGPGTFTGLRVGVSVAKGLVLGLGLPLLGVPTLAAAAFPLAAFAGGRAVVPVVAAGRGRLVWAEYRAGEEREQDWHLAVPPRNGTVAELTARLAAAPALVTGELSTEQETEVAGSPGSTLVPRALRPRRPAAIAAIAWGRLAAGERDDPVALEPTYVGR